MIFRDVQAERQELHHTALINLHELPIFRGEDEWRYMSEVHESKIAKRVYFAVKHGRYLLGALLLPSSQSILCGGWLGQPSVDSLGLSWCCFPSMIEFGEHEGMKGVVDRRRDFRCNDSVSLSVHQQTSRRAIQLAQVFGDPHLFRASCLSVRGFHFGLVAGP